MRKYLRLAVLLLSTLMIAPSIYLPFVASQPGYTSAQDAYDQVDIYLDRRIEAARINRIVNPATHAELWQLLNIPTECLAGAVPDLLEEKKVVEVEGVKLYLIRLRVCSGQFEVHGLLGKRIGTTGKRPLIITPPGSAGTPEILFGLTPEDFYHRYALRLAKEGYIVYAPVVVTQPGLDRSMRNQLYKRGLPTGEILLGVEVGQLMSSLGYLQSRTDVDSSKMGVYGLSLGGMLSAMWGAADDRLQAIIVSNWIEDREGKLTGHGYPLAMWEIDYSDYVYVPGWLNRFDDLALARLIYPRGLFIEVGNTDPRKEPVLALYPQLQEVYADKPELLGLEVGAGGHEIFFNGAVQWLNTLWQNDPG